MNIIFYDISDEFNDLLIEANKHSVGYQLLELFFTDKMLIISDEFFEENIDCFDMDQCYLDGKIKGRLSFVGL